jgi:peptidoglycan hydrolase CwlO-like protein
MYRLLIPVCFVSGLLSCTTNEPLTTINLETITNTENSLAIKDPYTQFALETCDCMQPMIDKVNEAESLSQNHIPTSEKLQKCLQEIEDMRPQIEECNKIVKNRFSSIVDKNPNNQLFLEAMKHHCPSAFAVISKGISMKN